MIPKTFLEIEKQLGIQYSIENGSLPEWYNSVRDKEFKDFEISDLCKCVRQNLFLDYLYPFILKKLEHDINIGDIYDGELLISLKSVKKEFWKNNSDKKNNLLSLIKKNINNIDDDIISEVNELLNDLMK